MACYEQPLEPAYKQLLEGRGSLPDPFNIAGRIGAVQRVAQYEKERIQSFEAPDSAVTTRGAGRQSFGRSCRASVSPWDVPTGTESRSRLLPGESVLGLGRVASCHKYVPPAALHSLTATFTLPARVFIILTNRGVFRLQQQRFSELYKDAAETLIQTSTATDSPSVNIIESFCSPPLVLDLSHLHCILNPELRTSPSSPPNLSLLNVFAAAQLFEPGQVMAVIWQTLTLTYGKIPWPSSKMKGSSVRRDVKGATLTPFNRPGRFVGSSSPAIPAVVSTQKAFPWSLLVEILVTLVSDPTVNSNPVFADCIEEGEI